MYFVALTQQTCSWLLAHPGVLTVIYETITNDDLASLTRSEFAQGSLRMAGSEDGRVLAVWNRDYLSGTGSEQWGIFKLTGEHGLQSEPSISQQVFERILYVANQRLQGLVIDSDFIHRAWPNGSHSCLAGRGNEARQFSLAYFEAGPGFADLNARNVLIVGPEHDFDTLQDSIASEIHGLSLIVQTANRLADTRRRRPLLEAPAFAKLRDVLSSGQGQTNPVSVRVSKDYSGHSATANPYESLHWAYAQWIASGSLSEAQRRVLNSHALVHRPLRIIGPAGSGKTLLMQLLVMEYLFNAQSNSKAARVLYIVHNAAMAQSVTDRFRVLGAEDYLTDKKFELSVQTLSEYGRRVIDVGEAAIIDKDAQKTKEFQFEQVQDALRAALEANPKAVKGSQLLLQVLADPQLFEIFALLVMAEISTVIKGRGLTEDQARYVSSDAPLSRLHRILSRSERELVFETFTRYHQVVFEQYEMLDSDDIALSLAGRLRTPVWKLRRKNEGYDVVFVDEAQLFNENERRVFPYLSKGNTAHVPIALALDEAQEPFGFSNAGLATLGIADADNEELPSNHRSTKEIVNLAFFVIQRSTDLFTNEFPDFTENLDAVGQTAAQAAPPVVVRCPDASPSFSKFVIRSVKKLRAKNIRQIAICCHAETYWKEIEDELRISQLPFHIMTQRGEKLSPDQPLVILSRPSFIGGQEFDAVILVGLELGIMPPRVIDNPPLSAALEQQVLREIYLTVTRARLRVILALNRKASLNTIMADALAAECISLGQID